MCAPESNKAMGYGGQTGIVFFTLWMLFQRERLLLLVGFWYFTKKGRGYIFFPLLSILKKSSVEFFVASGLLYLWVRGRSSTKRLWKPLSTCGTSSEVAAATRAWLIFVCIHWTVCANSFMPALPSRYGSQWKLGIKKSPWFKLGAVCWIW